MASDLITNATDSTFSDVVLNSELPVLVDFWATWCGPCKAIAPMLEDVAKAYEGKVRIVKVDVDQNGGTAMKYGIRSIPTLILFKDGQAIEQHVGAPPRQKIDTIVAKAL